MPRGRKGGYTTSGTVLVQGPNQRLKSEIQIGSELACHIEGRLPIRVTPHSHDMPKPGIPGGSPQNFRLIPQTLERFGKANSVLLDSERADLNRERFDLRRCNR
jgi:hypothetical protein